MPEYTPLFHRAHYNILAAQIKKNYPNSDSDLQLVALRGSRMVIGEFALSLAKRLKIDNPNFDAVSFLEACSPDPEMYPLQELWTDEEN